MWSSTYNIIIQRTAKALDQRDRTGVGGAACIARLSDQMRGKGAIDDAEHAAHDRRATCEEKAQRIGEAQNPLAHGLMR